ncbi:hypothetical protein N9U91_06045 [Pelagibacteraceae bacterium]|nr:hypothetical protein [Pelagibacteraceae bacterium]
MQVKDMFLKNEKYSFIFLGIIFFLICPKAFSVEDDRTRVSNYLNSLKHFSASFLQNDGENLSEGKVYIGKERIRAEYFYPTKILLILDQNKAMYYNYELEEDEFFNPKDTNAWFFYEIFRNPVFFLDSLLEVQNNELIIEKNGVNIEGSRYLIRVIFEKNPITLRGVEFFFNEDFLKLSIYNHNYNEDFDEGFFKLINPKFLN